MLDELEGERAVTRRWSPDYFLPGYARIFWVIQLLVWGIAPTVLFFVWIERNAGLPYLPIELGWPLVSLQVFIPVETSFAQLGIAQAFWNLLLILAFGAIHTGLAQVRAARVMTLVLPPQLVRAIYVCMTGVSLFLVMALWQHTGVTFWNFIPEAMRGWPGIVLSAVIYWGIMMIPLQHIRQFDLPDFLGFKPLYLRAGAVTHATGTETLVESGFYRHLRHPTYTFTLLAFLVAPWMTLDRMLVFAGMLIYLLAFGIPLEEKKLLKKFGQEYVRYRERVPALIPVTRRS